jgi:hypothetical protein
MITNMDTITRQRVALRVIRQRGYLNEFWSQCDRWFVAHSVPGGQSLDAAVIDANLACRLIDQGKVERVGDGRDLLDGGCRLVWYQLRAKQPDRERRE